VIFVEFYDFYFSLDNFLIVIFVTALGLILFVAPLLILIAIIRAISDRIRGVKRINNLVISRYAWYALKNDAVLTDSSIKQRVTRIVNFVAGQEEMIKRVRDS